MPGPTIIELRVHVDDPEWRGTRKASIANAIRDRLKVLADELDVCISAPENNRIKTEMLALIEQFPA